MIPQNTEMRQKKIVKTTLYCNKCSIETFKNIELDALGHLFDLRRSKLHNEFLLCKSFFSHCVHMGVMFSLKVQ